jgi:hypothetical protein
MDSGKANQARTSTASVEKPPNMKTERQPWCASSQTAILPPMVAPSA